MEDNYIKEKKIKDLSKEMKNEELLLNVMKTKLELEVARNNYEYAEDELVDYFAYQIKAIQAKLDYLLGKIKKKKINLDAISRRKLGEKEAI